MDADDMFMPPDWWFARRELFDECPKCGADYFKENLFCYKCLTNEEKWKLGVL